MDAINREVETLQELYRQLGLSDSLVPSLEAFTIHNLAGTGFNLPYRSKPFRPNYFSFVFVKDGIGEYSIDEESFRVHPGSIYFTNPSNYRTFGWDEIREVYLITFDETFLKKYLTSDVFEEFPFLLTETFSPKNATPDFYSKVEALYLLIQAEYQGNSIHKYKLIGHLLAAMLLHIKAYFWDDYNPIYEGNRGSQIVRSFKHSLEAHFRELTSGQITSAYRVNDFANMQNLHPTYLSNVIKSKTGKPIASWLAEKSITAAKSMLQNPGNSIKEITYRLGFSEPAHFSNHFKKHTGRSPSSYRASHLQSLL